MSSVTKVPGGKLPSNQADLWFENNAVGLMKKEIWEESEDKLKSVLAEYGLPAAGCEWAKPGRSVQRQSRARGDGCAFPRAAARRALGRHRERRARHSACLSCGRAR